MSGDGFRSRRFQPVTPDERVVRGRRAVRVVVVADESVLLLADHDPGLPNSRWWFTPGGGIDEGETERDAAVRELQEETGLRIRPSDLLGPVLRRTVVHGYSDQILRQDEAFFLLRVPDRFDVDDAGHTAEERVTLLGWGWHHLDHLNSLDEPVWPIDLAALVTLADRPEEWPFEVGEVEESTLPLPRKL